MNMYYLDERGYGCITDLLNYITSELSNEKIIDHSKYWWKLSPRQMISSVVPLSKLTLTEDTNHVWRIKIFKNKSFSRIYGNYNRIFNYLNEHIDTIFSDHSITQITITRIRCELLGDEK